VVVEAVAFVPGVHPQRDRAEDVLDVVALQQVAQVDGPGAAVEALFFAHFAEVSKQVLPVPFRQHHQHARHAAVPVVLLLEVRQLDVELLGVACNTHIFFTNTSWSLHDRFHLVSVGIVIFASSRPQLANIFNSTIIGFSDNAEQR
jgi:hypothetical protein